MNLPDAYRRFFIQSEEGRHFIQSLEQMIARAHADSEGHPENARDNSQRAKGVREVLSHIRTATTKPKKGGAPK